MEHQDLLTALKGKHLHWRDEDNEFDGVINYITTNEGEYILLFDDFVQVTMDNLHIEELATAGHTCDKRYTYCLDKPPIEFIREALVGKRLRWGDERDVSISSITAVRESKAFKNDVVVFAGIGIAMTFPTVYELMATGESSDERYQYRLLEDEPNTTLHSTAATTTASGEVTFADGIDWEARTWDVFRHLNVVDGVEAKTALLQARWMVEVYRKAMEGEV